MESKENTERDRYNPWEAAPLYCLIAAGLTFLFVIMSLEEKERYSHKREFDHRTREVFINPAKKNNIIVSSPVQTYHCFDDDKDGKTLERIIIYPSTTTINQSPELSSITYTPAANPELFKDLNKLYQESRR